MLDKVNAIYRGLFRGEHIMGDIIRNTASKPSKKNVILKEAGTTAVILVGVAITTFATIAFALPYHILVGGSTGLGVITNHFIPGIPLSAAVLFFNVVLLLAARFCLGRRYALSIILGSLSYPMFLALFTRMGFKNSHLVEDPLVAAIAGGALMGVGLGIILRAGRSMGGSDVLPLILHKKIGTKIGPVMYIQDSIILLLQFFNATVTDLILAILVVFIYSTVSQKIILMGNGLVQFQIYSGKTREILDELLNFGIGATLLNGTSGLLKQKMEMINSVTTLTNMNRVKKLILDIDPKAFITISMVQEVNGRGFTIVDENKEKYMQEHLYKNQK